MNMIFLMFLFQANIKNKKYYFNHFSKKFMGTTNILIFNIFKSLIM
jgi:hypothetical protein